MSEHLAASATWQEIQSQPTLWSEWGRALDIVALRDWVDGLGVSDVWLSGAGSSAYIGDILAAGFEGVDGLRLRAVASTDIVARPHAFLRGPPRLVVSFGRSGNSSESVGVLDAMDALVPNWPRLSITCNAGSALAGRAGGKAIILPEATHDAGFAMTSSFSTMLLTAAALFDRSLSASAVPGRWQALSDALSALLPSYRQWAENLPLPERVVFTGSGALAFAARESALKVLELSAGIIPALSETSLGFRHGPKSFVLPGTMIVAFRSGEPHARAYDDDLIAELRQQFPEARIAVPEVDAAFGDLWSAPLHVALAQVLAVVWSHRLGLAVDDPFAGRGTLSRVVSGVRLHGVTGR